MATAARPLLLLRRAAAGGRPSSGRVPARRAGVGKTCPPTTTAAAVGHRLAPAAGALHRAHCSLFSSSAGAGTTDGRSGNSSTSSTSSRINGPAQILASQDPSSTSRAAPLSTDARCAPPLPAAAAAAAVPDPTAASAPGLVPPPTPSDYLTATLELSKARLSALVVVTSTAGFLTAGGPISYPTLAACAAGTGLCSSSASTLNQIFELERDRAMKRTRRRPLVRGVVSPRTASALAVATGTGGGAILLAGTDPVTATLGVGNIALYAGLYTYLKPRSEVNTWVGAVVGAVPPVMGWTAATSGSLLDLEAALLGGTLFLWQFPHFFALSWMHRADYARGGFQMVPVNDVLTNGDRTADLINRYTWYMATIPLVSSALGVTSSMFAVEGIVLNAYALHVARKFDGDRTNGNARKVFLTSLWYLPCLMTLFILHSRRWRDSAEKEEEEQEDLAAMLKRKAAYVRDRGRELCLHEVLAVAADGDGEENGGGGHGGNGSKCPVALGRSTVTEATEKGAVAVASAVAAGNATAVPVPVAVAEAEK